MPLAEQLEFVTPAPESADLQAFLDYLIHHPGWTTAKEFQNGLDGRSWNERKTRKLAELSDGYVISGDLGYKHISHATPEEIHHFTYRMEAQAKRMLDRCCAARKRAHETIHHQPLSHPAA